MNSIQREARNLLNGSRRMPPGRFIEYTNRIINQLQLQHPVRLAIEGIRLSRNDAEYALKDIISEGPSPSYGAFKDDYEGIWGTERHPSLSYSFTNKLTKIINTTKPKEAIMSLAKSAVPNSLTPNMDVVQVSLDPGRSSRLYSYYTHTPLEEGDWVTVVVEDQVKCGCVSKVKGLSVSAINKASKCIVDRVDLEAYKERVDQLTSIRELKNKLKQRREQLDEVLIFEQLAQSDPEMRQLVDQMNGLIPNAIPSLDKTTGASDPTTGATETKEVN